MNGTHAAHETPTARMGKASIVLGLVGLASLAWLWVISATSFDPPQWLRILGSSFLPVGLFGGLATATLGMLREDGKATSKVGLLLAAVTVVLFVLVYNAYD